MFAAISMPVSAAPSRRHHSSAARKLPFSAAKWSRADVAPSRRSPGSVSTAKVTIELCVSRAQRASLVGFFQFFSGELSNALEHEQTLAAIGHLASDQALVKQLVEPAGTIPGERVRDDGD